MLNTRVLYLSPLLPCPITSVSPIKRHICLSLKRFETISSLCQNIFAGLDNFFTTALQNAVDQVKTATMLFASNQQKVLDNKEYFTPSQIVATTGKGAPMSQSDNDILRSRQITTLRGTIHVPGDKSISHRSLILGSLAIGETLISGLLEGADVLATKDALIGLGVDISKIENGDWRVTGVGLNGMVSPVAPLDLGNSGTGVRLLMGVIAGQDITATFSGDASLSSRPMARITDPLASMGARITTREAVASHDQRCCNTASSPIQFQSRVGAN